MTKITKRLITLLFLMSALLSPFQVSAAGLLIPAYFDPGPQGGLWNQIAAAAQQAHVIAIMNPNNGPGSTMDSGYANAINKVRRAGGKIIGYVSTRYGQRPISEVVGDIQQYVRFYRIDGIFLDEMSSDNLLAHLQFYQSLYRHIKALNPRFMVVGNPGTDVPESYLTLPVADLLVLLESSAGDFTSHRPPAWVSHHGAAHFAYLA